MQNKIYLYSSSIGITNAWLFLFCACPIQYSTPDTGRNQGNRILVHISYKIHTITTHLVLYTLMTCAPCSHLSLVDHVAMPPYMCAVKSLLAYDLPENDGESIVVYSTRWHIFVLLLLLTLNYQKTYIMVYAVK